MVYKKWVMGSGGYLIDLYLEMHLPAGLAKFMTAALHNYCLIKLKMNIDR